MQLSSRIERPGYLILGLLGELDRESSFSSPSTEPILGDGLR